MKGDDKQVEALRAKDKIFNIFCEDMNEIPDYQENNAKQKALEEQWAMFLKRADNNDIPYDILEDEAKALTTKLKNKSDGFYNPNHLIERGVHSLCNNNNKEAISHFKKAQLDTGTLPNIIGGLYENTCKINEDKSNKTNI